MSLEKASISWSAKQLSVMVTNGKVNFEHIVQRSYVWENTRKSALIESMMVGYPIPSIFAKKNILEDDMNNEEKGKKKSSNSIYYIMDGKQRLSTIKEYLSDEFSLTPLNPVTYHDINTDNDITVDVSGKLFSELPEALQDILKDYMLNVIYFENLNKDEERELFKRLNAGKPLTAKNRTLASCKDIEGLLQIGEHELFNEMLTEKARDGKNQVSIICKAYCMLYKRDEDISFETKVLNPIIEQMEISEQEREVLDKIFDYTLNVHQILFNRKEKVTAKKFYTETHFISLVPWIKKAIDENMSEEKFADWLVIFYGDKRRTSISDEYNFAATGASAKRSGIQIRNNALEKSWKEYQKKLNPQDYEPDKMFEKYLTQSQNDIAEDDESGESDELPFN